MVSVVFLWGRYKRQGFYFLKRGPRVLLTISDFNNSHRCATPAQHGQTMVIHTDSSIVPDSTISSSPPPSISPVVKRATFTYGRRKDPQFTPDLDSSATLAESSSSSRPIVYSTGHSDFDEEVPPSSDPPGAPESSGMTRVEGDIETPFSFTRRKDINKELNGEFDGNESPISPARSDDAGLSKFEFSWKAQLKLIDEDDSDDPDRPMVSPGGRGSSNALHFSEEQGIDAPMSLASSLSSKDTQSLTVDDVFGGSLPSQTGPSSPAPSLFASGASCSATPDIRVAKRTQKRAVVIDSDDDLGDSSFGSVPHPINTPKLRSSPTPPTSDTDLSAAKLQSKGKGNAPFNGVPPLMFEKNSEATSKAPHIKKSIHKGKLKAKDSRPKIKVPIICSSFGSRGGY
jgi:mediator of replication checkpoint protein 1